MCVIFSPVGVKGKLSLLGICSFVCVFLGWYLGNLSLPDILSFLPGKNAFMEGVS